MVEIWKVCSLFSRKFRIFPDKSQQFFIKNNSKILFAKFRNFSRTFYLLLKTLIGGRGLWRKGGEARMKVERGEARMRVERGEARMRVEREGRLG